MQREERECKASQKTPSVHGVFKIKINLIEVQVAYTIV